MLVHGRPFRTIWAHDDNTVEIIDQTLLPHRFEIAKLTDVEAMAVAIRSMQVRGAPLIGAAAAYGLYLAMQRDASDAQIDRASALLIATRPTAVNLRWAVDRVSTKLRAATLGDRASLARLLANELADEDVEINRSIGQHGAEYLQRLVDQKRSRGDTGPLRILTHCNAGWLATVDWGTATAPIYTLHQRGVPVHVWVEETRPRNQGASLTAWELGEAGVPHALIVDNAGGHLMQHGQVDVVIVGTDRTTARGDVCNKIGTYLKALAARDNDIPFLVAAPSPSIDLTLDDGVAQIPIEERDPTEVTHVTGLAPNDVVTSVRICPASTQVSNPGFDVTPARLVTALITERGICAATREGIAALLTPNESTRATTRHPADLGHVTSDDTTLTQRTLRREIISTSLKMNDLGINHGKSGNVSARISADAFLITPTGIRYEALDPSDIVEMNLSGDVVGPRSPSSEWRFHRDIYAARPEVGAIVHTHAPFSTALACLRLDIPSFHYMVAVAGGASIRCAPYALFGTQALSDFAIAALADRKACLLANHGMIATGATLTQAIDLAVEVESLAAQYVRSRTIGEPVLLDEAQMAEAIEKFKTYGRQPLHSAPMPVSRAIDAVRNRVGSLVAEGLFEGLSTLGRNHPRARKELALVDHVRDIDYRGTGKPEHRLDIHRHHRAPKPPALLPIVMYVHGGGFRILSKETHWGMALSFARQGYLVFNVNYRLAPQHPYPAAVEDVCAALQWVHAHAREHGGDPNRIILAGESAGANLVATLALITSYRRPEPFARAVFDAGIRPTAVVPKCGVFQVSDLQRFHKLPLLGIVRDRLDEVGHAYLSNATSHPEGGTELADPVVLLEKGGAPDRPLPPCFTSVGTRDPLLDDTRRITAAWKAHGARCEARYYPGEPHAFQAFLFTKNARSYWGELFAFLREVNGPSSLIKTHTANR